MQIFCLFPNDKSSLLEFSDLLRMKNKFKKSTEGRQIDKTNAQLKVQYIGIVFKIDREFLINEKKKKKKNLKSKEFIVVS